ncbi:MAG: SpoIID/LytB domain-containing protein [Planctomycetota bacterium]
MRTLPLLLVLALPLAASPEAPPKVRVLVVSNSASFHVEVDGPYVVTKADETKPIGRGASLKVDVVAEKGVTRIGAAKYADEEIDIIPAKPETLTVGKKKYAGALRIVRRDEALLGVNVVDLEDYVAGVIGAEMGAESHREALAVQAIISRGFGVRQVDEEHKSKAKRWFDVYDDTRDQVYAGLSKTTSAVRKAVEETRGKVLLYDGKPFTTYFHSTCGGHTEPVEAIFGGTAFKPLSGVACTWCEKSRVYEWTAKYTEAEVRDLLVKAGHKLGDAKRIEVVDRMEHGRVTLVKVWSTGAAKPLEVSGKALREALDVDKLLSTKFEVTRDGEAFLFTGHGWGHGVGLCQTGAMRMAEKGKKAEEILETYYPGAKVTAAYRGK